MQGWVFFFFKEVSCFFNCLSCVFHEHNQKTQAYSQRLSLATSADNEKYDNFISLTPFRVKTMCSF